MARKKTPKRVDLDIDYLQIIDAIDDMVEGIITNHKGIIDEDFVRLSSKAAKQRAYELFTKARDVR